MSDHDDWLEQQARREAIEEAIEELELSDLLVALTGAERARIAASLTLTAAVQLALGDDARARRSAQLARKVRGLYVEDS